MIRRLGARSGDSVAAEASASMVLSEVGAFESPVESPSLAAFAVGASVPMVARTSSVVALASCSIMARRVPQHSRKSCAKTAAKRRELLRESISELLLRGDHARCEKFQRRVERASETRACASR